MSRALKVSQIDLKSSASLLGLAAVLVLAPGCNPVTTGAKLGVRIVGDVIEDVDVKEKGDSLVGRPGEAADGLLGKPIDTFKDTRSDRRWRSYPVKLDVLGRQRYVVETRGGRVVSVSKAQMSERKVDIPRVLILKEKLKGKPPRDCQAALEFGSPLLTARSETSGRLVQIYQAGMITDLGKPHYCIVRYDAGERCEDVDFIAVEESSGRGALGG